MLCHMAKLATTTSSIFTPSLGKAGSTVSSIWSAVLARSRQMRLFCTQPEYCSRSGHLFFTAGRRMCLLCQRHCGVGISSIGFKLSQRDSEVTLPCLQKVIQFRDGIGLGLTDLGQVYAPALQGPLKVYVGLAVGFDGRLRLSIHIPKLHHEAHDRLHELLRQRTALP